jgi:hypothetical protein
VIHFLTVGFLDAAAVPICEIRPMQPLSEPLLALLDSYLDKDCEEPKMEGEPVIVTETYIRCPWHAPSRNRTAERFAMRAAQEFGCVVADIRHGRVVPIQELMSR